ncbi:MAG: helix-turn-helix domain-containing protein [Nakamurella sp.]
MTTYAQFCPVAKAMEVLDERWTLLVIREMLAGSSRFSEIRRGVPRMSPALLSKRLRTLQRAEVVRRDLADGEIRYRLTESGMQLFEVVQALGLWGLRWVGQLGQEDLDPHLLFWDLQRTIPLASWPLGRTTLAFEFDDVERRHARWWVVVVGADDAADSEVEVDICDADPGHEVAATVVTSLRAMVRVWRGDLDWDAALAAGALHIVGPAATRRAVPQWLGRSMIAQLAEVRAG